LTIQQIRQLKREYRAICGLLQRSGFDISARNFHTSLWCGQNRNSPQNSNPPPPNQPNDDKKPNREDDEETKMSSLLAKAFLWMLTAYLLIGVVSLLFPSSNQPEVRKIYFKTTITIEHFNLSKFESYSLRPCFKTLILKKFQVTRYVSWNEFVHHMLAKGEVEEVIVRPDMDIVTIILHDGAIIKGRRVIHHGPLTIYF
jgi:spastic paraplegia 7